MFSGDLGKPFGRFDNGPDTGPQVRLAYHGQGTPHQLVYTSNPVSWLVGLTDCFPFLNILSANAAQPVDSSIVGELDSGEVPTGPLIGGGSVWFNGQVAPPMPTGAVTPRMDTTVTGAPIPIVGFAPHGTPLGQLPSGRTVPLYGSRKTLVLPTNQTVTPPNTGTVTYG
jgi:hypothetical protein